MHPTAQADYMCLDLEEWIGTCKVELLKKCSVETGAGWDRRYLHIRKRMQTRAVLVREGSVGVEKVWKDLKECILEEAVVVCGETRGIARWKEMWWWNEEIAASVKKKQRLFELWKRPNTCKKECRCRKTGGRKLCGRGERLETGDVTRAWKPGGGTTTRQRLLQKELSRSKTVWEEDVL